MARTKKQRATLEAMGVRIFEMKVSATTQVPTAWNKEQAELLRRIALTGGSCAADDCLGAALEALISTGFLRMEGGDRVVLTDAGLARARELRSPPSG
jgi:hypothetical protein